MPILQELSIAAGMNPIYLMMAAAVACSFAFMLPVATPPSAIVFAHGYLSIPDMASAGLAMNVIAVFILTVGINTWGNLLFNFATIPVIFQEILKNQTLIGPVIEPIESMFNVSKPLVWSVVRFSESEDELKDVHSIVLTTASITEGNSGTISFAQALEFLCYLVNL